MLEKCDNVDSCAILEACGKHFCSTLDLKNIKWQDIFQHFAELESDDCEKHQEKLIKLTIESDLNVEYPVRSTYQLSFLKHCITQAEKSNLEFAKAYELYIKLLHDKSLCGEETSYKHYFLGDKPITLKENNSFISGGTTGLCTWQAGIALANWCLSYGNILLSKRVVELGCGAGLTGLVILQSDFLPKEYVFTDSHPLVLQQLKSNLEINISGESWPRSVKSTQVDISDFDWGDETKIKDFSEADIFLGAGGRSERWIPPRSPYCLIQEDLYSNPWQLLIATIFLSKTAAPIAIPAIHRFLRSWPTPESCVEAGYDEIHAMLSPLGLGHTRTRLILRFTHEYLEKEWLYPIELHGIGKYGNDSYRMFCVNEWRQVQPDDIPLTMYRNWLLENEKELGL